MANRSTLLSRVVACLSATDPEAALERAIEALREFDVVVREVGPDTLTPDPARTVALAERALCWSAKPPLDDADNDALRAALTLGLRRIAERESQERTQERLEVLSAASFEGILIHENGVVVDANQRMSELLGYEPAELLGSETLAQTVVPEDLPMVLEHVRSRYEGLYTVTGVRKDGSQFRAELQARQAALGDRKLRVVAVRDVTERERRDRMVEESERRFRQLASAVFDAIIASRNGHVVEATGNTEALFGTAPAEMQGRPVADFVAPEERPRARRILEEQRLERIEMMLTHADGSSTPAEITPILTTLEESPVRLSGIRDLRVQKREQAERVALEQRIAQSQRIESLGVLAGGIAHDFNNLLLGLLGHAEWLARQIRDPEQLDALEAIRTAGERAAALTAQMLAYAGRKELGERRTIDLKNLLLELDGLLKAALSKKARLSLELQPGSFVLGDRATLTQVLMNLLTNASDALGDQVGTIGVRTELLSELPERWQTAVEPVERVAPNGYVEIRVSDDGKGMTQDMVARVFEPFFTTKGGQGHGLGLAAVHGIVRAHGGAVRVDSTVGKGSCFRVLLPLAPRGPSLAPKAADWTAGATCRVLVIDDEPLVRSFLTRALVDAGYSVEEAKDGATALDTLTRTTPDLVLLDMTLPDLDGVEILRRIRQSGHAMPVLLASGYLADDVKDTLQPGSFQGFLQKPFRIDKLLRTVDETLERTALGAKNGTSSAQTS